MKNVIRSWLGINDDMKAIANDVNKLHAMQQDSIVNIFEIFHAIPYGHGIMKMMAHDAARITEPNGVGANSLPALLTGIVLKARQGQSQLEVHGTLDNEVRDALVSRKFKVEDFEGSAGKSTFIIWT